MKFAIVLALLGVLLAPTLANESNRRTNGEGPHLPPHNEGPRHPPVGENLSLSPRGEGPHNPPANESPRRPPLGENPHYLMHRGNLHRPHHVGIPYRPRPYFGNRGFAFRLPEGSNNWKTVWDAKTGFIATKVLGKNTCIISKADAGFNGFEGASAGYLPPIEHRYVISNDRLLNLYPYGPRIQRLCRGIPTYFAFPSPGSNFSEDDASCFRNVFRNMKLTYCGL